MADLSEDSLPPEERVVANLGLEESAHRIGAQKTAINAAITMSVLLLMAAIVMAGCMLWLIAKDSSIHWHSSVLVAALTIPPPVIMVAVLRAVFQTAQKDKEEKSEATPWPAQEVVKELIKALKDSAMKP